MADSEAGKTTLMVVDDSRLMRVAARKILKNDFTIIEAADGEEAWETLQQHSDIALVMSDLSMPNLDGLGLLKRIRESRFSELPVIIITGAEDDDGSKQNALASGASDFITKPFESIQLLARVKAQARQKDTQEALQQSEAEKQQLHETSQLDPLTGLANKRAFTNYLEENLAYATRHHAELSLLLVRIDKYKILYLRRGKQVAETLSRKLAETLCVDRRREDTVGRIALDVFGILLPSANLPGSKRVLHQLTEAIKQMEIRVDGEQVPFNVSFGLCNVDIRAGIRADEVLALAEAELPTPSSLTAPPTRQATKNPKQVRTAEKALPAAVIAPKPEKRCAATSADIQYALNALANNARPVASADDLMRGVLPILDNWNHSHNQQHDSLINALRAALNAEKSPETATTQPRQPPELLVD